MSDRSIVLRLRAEVAQAVAGLDKTAKAAEKVGTATEQASKKSKFSLEGTAASIRTNEEHYNRLGNGALVAGGLVATGIGFGVKAFADFDEAMSQASAALPEAGAQMGKLRQLAIDLGKDTKFSSTEAAQGITELAKAGVDASDIYGGGLKGALDLAAAGGLDVGRAAEIAGIAVKQFNLEGSDVPHVADLFAAAAGKAVGSVDDIAQAMKYAGITASSLGIDIEETTGVIGLFAEKGIIGEQAGTSFRSMLLSLTAPSKVGAKAMEDLGISVFDNEGKFIGLAGSAEQLKQRLGPLDEATRTAALGQIFGNESISAAIELYKAGASGVQDWTSKVNDAGFAAEQAAKLTDNLKGDFERLTGAIDAVAVQNGGGLNDFLRDLTQGAEGAVEAFGRLPGPLQQGVLGLAALTGGGLLAFGALSKVVTSGANMIESLSAIREGGGRAASGLDKATKAAKGLAAAGVVIAATAISLKALVDASNDEFEMPGVGELTRDLVDAANASGALDKAFSTTGQTINGSTSLIDGFDEALKVATDPSRFQQFEGAAAGMLGMFDDTKVGVATAQFERLDQTLSSMFSSGHTDEAAALFDTVRTRAEAAGVPVETLNRLFPEYTDAVAGASAEQKLAGSSGDAFSSTIEGIGEDAKTAKESLSDLADEIRGFGSAALGAQTAESDFQAAVDAATASAKEHGRTLNLNTTAGRANDDQLRSLATAALGTSAATLELTGSTEAAAAKMVVGRAEFIKVATAMTGSKTEAVKLADAYGLIPADVRTNVTAPGVTAATGQVRGFIKTVNGVPASKIARIAAQTSGVGSVQYLKSLVDSMNSKTVSIRYVVAGRSTGGGIPINEADGGMLEHRRGALVQAFASGGMWDGSFGTAQPQIRAAGGAGVRWAEHGAGPWEAFVSGHPAKLPRSRVITEDLVGRLGGQVQWLKAYAGGGIHDRFASRPAPMSLSPIVNVTAPASSAAIAASFSDAQVDRIGDRIAQKMADAQLAIGRNTAVADAATRKAGR